MGGALGGRGQDSFCLFAVVAVEVAVVVVVMLGASRQRGGQAARLKYYMAIWTLPIWSSSSSSSRRSSRRSRQTGNQDVEFLLAGSPVTHGTSTGTSALCIIAARAKKEEARAGRGENK